MSVKIVAEVFISQPASTFPATDAKQFYVSVSRAKNKVHIYTDDKQGLLEHASEVGNRISALELVSTKNLLQEFIAKHERERPREVIPSIPPLKENKHNQKPIDRDYEPGF